MHNQRHTKDPTDDATTKMRVISPSQLSANRFSTVDLHADSKAEEVADMPRQIGPYRILAKIGRGGMGTVYHVVHAILDRHFAMKIVHHKHTNNENVLRLFANEITVLGNIRHPKIVQVYGDGDDSGHRYMIMELLEGEDLAEHVKRRGALPVSMALDYVKQAAQALSVVHQEGFVHRDVKPSNLFLTEENEIKLLDLGLVQALHECTPESKDTQESSNNQVNGSPEFMAPEQILKNISDERSDLYSLGCTLYYTLTGHVPFESPEHPNVMSILYAQVTKELPPLEHYRDDLNPKMKELLRKMTAKNPDERFQTMNELIAAIEQPLCYKKYKRKVDLVTPVRFARMTISAASILLMASVLWISTSWFATFPHEGTIQEKSYAYQQATCDFRNCQVDMPYKESGCQSDMQSSYDPLDSAVTPEACVDPVRIPICNTVVCREWARCREHL